MFFLIKDERTVYVKGIYTYQRALFLKKMLRFAIIILYNLSETQSEIIKLKENRLKTKNWNILWKFLLQLIFLNFMQNNQFYVKRL